MKDWNAFLLTFLADKKYHSRKILCSGVRVVPSLGRLLVWWIKPQQSTPWNNLYKSDLKLYEVILDYKWVPIYFRRFTSCFSFWSRQRTRAWHRRWRRPSSCRSCSAYPVPSWPFPPLWPRSSSWRAPPSPSPQSRCFPSRWGRWGCCTYRRKWHLWTSNLICSTFSIPWKRQGENALYVVVAHITYLLCSSIAVLDLMNQSNRNCGAFLTAALWNEYRELLLKDTALWSDYLGKK